MRKSRKCGCSATDISGIFYCMKHLFIKIPVICYGLVYKNVLKFMLEIVERIQTYGEICNRNDYL